MRVRVLSGLVGILALACPKSDAVAPQPEDSGVSDGGPPAVILPIETADDDALSEISWVTLPVLRADRKYQQQSSADRGKGGDGGLRLFGNGNRDMNNFLCAGEGADGGKPLVPLVLDLPKCPDSYVKGFVVSRFEGSGRMTRLWLTALSWRGGPPDDEILRIYVDDATTPVLQAPLGQLNDGSAGEMFAPPFGAGTSHFLAWHYPVVFGKKLVVTIDGLGLLDTYYHQTDVVLDATTPPGGARKSAAARLPRRDEAKKALRETPSGGEWLATAPGIVLDPEKPLEVANIMGPATIGRMRLLELPKLEDLNQIDVSVTWDDAATPAIAMNAAEFFGAANDPPPGGFGLGSALALSMPGDRAVQLSLPMPFAKRARFSLVNHSKSPIKLTFDARGDKGVPSGKFGNLYAERHETKGPTTTSFHAVESVKGPGRHVGACIAMEGHAMSGSELTVDPFNFLEGDERGKIDGVLALAGTGTEDFFDSAFYFVGAPSVTPFAQFWGLSSDTKSNPAHGKVTACRWHLFDDVIDFAAGFDLDLEIGPGDPGLLDRYRSVAFSYR